MTYTEYVTALATMMGEQEDGTDFVTILPTIITYAEDRMYRELQLLAARVVDQSQAVTANTRNYTLPQASGRFVTVDEINIFTPVSTFNVRNPVVRTSLDVINAFWPSTTAASATTVPQLYAMLTDQIVVFGSPPGAAFNCEIIGQVLPATLSAANPTTWLSLYLPDVFLNCSMIMGSGYQKNFSAMGDDPKAPAAWEAQYKQSLASANFEELKRRYGAPKVG